MPEDYEPAEYWSDRLSSMGGLRSTGHASYGERYNRWLYRRKAAVLDRALATLPSLDRCVDLGSGVGWVVGRLLRLGAGSVHGFDISADAVESLRDRFPAQRFDVARIGEEQLPLDDASTDCVTFLDVSYHIVDDDVWLAAVSEAARILVPGGGLVVTDAFGDRDERPADHVHFRTAEEWHRCARASGLEPESILPCYRWLSRPRQDSSLRRLPEGLRGAVEFALDTIAPTPPHLRCVVYRRQ